MKYVGRDVGLGGEGCECSRAVCESQEKGGTTLREVFTAQLADVAEKLVVMAEAVTTSISDATAALETPDLTRAEAVIAGDRAIDTMQAELDELAVTLLARQAPVASDLRVVVTALRISSSLERMGDLSHHIAKLVRMRFPDPVVPEELRPLTKDMAGAAYRLALKTTTLLDTRNIDTVGEVQGVDDELDALHRRMFTAVSHHESLSTEQIVDCTLLSRYFERFGDHGVGIAGYVDFLVTGSPHRWSPNLTDVS